LKVARITHDVLFVSAPIVYSIHSIHFFETRDSSNAVSDVIGYGAVWYMYTVLFCSNFQFTKASIHNVLRNLSPYKKKQKGSSYNCRERKLFHFHPYTLKSECITYV